MQPLLTEGKKLCHTAGRLQLPYSAAARLVESRLRLCTEKSNISVCYDAYEQFLLMVREQKDDIIGAKNVFAKYSNRQQRRAAAKANK